MFAKFVCATVLVAVCMGATVTLNGKPFKEETFKAKDVIEFDLKDTKPEVAFLRLKSAQKESYFSFNQKLHLNVYVERHLQPGTYDVTLITSVPNLEKSIGKIVVDYELSKAEVARLDNSEAKLWAARPEFLHQFRGEPKKAPILAALVFSGALALPWLFLFGLLAKAQVRLQITMILKNTIFHGVIGGILFVMWGYWVKASIFPTLGLLSILAVALVIIPVSSGKQKQN